MTRFLFSSLIFIILFQSKVYFMKGSNFQLFNLSTSYMYILLPHSTGGSHPGHNPYHLCFRLFGRCGAAVGRITTVA